MRSKIREGFLMLSAIMMTFLGGGMAGAVENPVSVGENPDSPQNIEIHRTITGLKNKVTNTFSYTLTEAEGNPGPVTGFPDYIQVDFNAANVYDGVVTRIGYLELNNLTFTEVGDYTFILTETGSTNAEAYPIDPTQYYVYVSVRNQLIDGQPTGGLIATALRQTQINGEGDKVDVAFTSQAVLTYAQISKVVEGNMARRDEYFKFRVNLDGVSDGDTFTISGQDASVEYGGEIITTQTQIVAGRENYVYLKHGQTVLIGSDGTTMELPVNVEFTVAEEVTNGYAAWIDEEETNSSTSLLALADISHPELLDAANQVNFINKKEAGVLTGVAMNVLPFALLAVISVAGVLVVRKAIAKKK